MTPIALRPRSTGEILDAAFELYRSRFVSLILIAAVGMAPISFASSWSWLAVRYGGFGTGPEIALGIIGMLSLIPVMLVYGALTHGSARVAEGGEVRIGPAYAVSARRFPALFGAGCLAVVLAAVVLGGCTIAAMLVLGAFAVAGGVAAGVVGEAVAAAAVVLGGVGAFLVFLLGFGLLAASLFAVLPLVVLDRSGPLGSIRRSWELSRGGRAKIIAVMLVAWLIILLPTMGLPMMLTGPAAMLDPAASANLSDAQLALQGIGSFVASVLTTPYMVGCLVLLYYDRRVATEALDLERAVATLDAER